MSESANDVTDTSIALSERHSAKLPATSDDKPKRMQIRGKLADAIERMVELGEPYNDAAKNAGLTTRAIRKALDKPHVIAYLRQRKQVLRERMSASNIVRLAQIRDAANNMPAVNAIKVLEQLGDEQQQRGSGVTHSAGVTIRIVNVVAASTVDTHAASMSSPDVNEINTIDGSSVDTP